MIMIWIFITTRSTQQEKVTKGLFYLETGAVTAKGFFYLDFDER